jgi:hypothetical protein
MGKLASPREALPYVEIVEDFVLLVYEGPIFSGCRLPEILHNLIDEEMYLLYVYQQKSLLMLCTIVKHGSEVCIKLKPAEHIVCKIEDVAGRLLSII